MKFSYPLTAPAVSPAMILALVLHYTERPGIERFAADHHQRQQILIPAPDQGQHPTAVQRLECDFPSYLASFFPRYFGVAPASRNNALDREGESLMLAAWDPANGQAEGHGVCD
jgi:hypothetical protein